MLRRLYFEVEAVSKTCSEENGLGHHKRFGFKSPTNLGNHTVVTAIHHFFKVHLRYGHWVLPNATMSRTEVYVSYDVYVFFLGKGILQLWSNSLTGRKNYYY